MAQFNWQCPYCNNHVTIVNNQHSRDRHLLQISNALGDLVLSSLWTVCPNEECQQPTLTAAIHEALVLPNGVQYGKELHRFELMPRSNARSFPQYVPEPIREDYQEAALIRDLSPKASATLSRRALQGVLRDFYQIQLKDNRLVKEIEAVKDKMEPDLWDTLHDVRKVGNIGAHMESDINVIVDVDPNEAQTLLELIETVIEETYLRREERRERLAKVKAVAAAKEAAKAPAPAPKP